MIQVLTFVFAIAGMFALQGAPAQTTAGLNVERHGAMARLDFSFADAATGKPITKFDIDMTKQLHLIIVSDDFREFRHVHPTLQPSGHFTIDQTLDPSKSYEIYADATPHGHPKQVFRFAVGEGGSASKDLSERSRVANVDGYTVSLSTNAVMTGESEIHVTIAKNGKPATDLHPYLGAPAHAVFLNAADLSYVHVHPMPPGMKMPHMTMSDTESMGSEHPLPDSATLQATMLLHVHLAEPGTYKLWLQFRGGDGLHVAPFVVTAH